MATAFTHAFVAGALVSLAPPGPDRTRLAVAGAVLAVLPDLDVLAFRFDIGYAHPLGHRGLSHSLPFAALTALAAASALTRELRTASARWRRAALILFACTASHGVLDAFTDAGLGVGFFVPFDTSRHFFPWRPLATSPLGIRAFFSGPALPILANEILWVWLPLGAAAAAAHAMRRRPPAHRERAGGGPGG